jgi:hypothetical protein
LSPQDVARFRAFAIQRGTDPAALAKQLLTESLPPAQSAGSTTDDENAAAIAMLNSWLADDATDDPEELRQAEADLNELLQNLNKNRTDSGERPLFPWPSV